MAIVGKWGLNGNANALVGPNGTATNITWVDGKSNGAGSFNGSSSKVETSLTVPNNNNLSFECILYDDSLNNLSTRMITADSGGGYFILQSNRPSPNNDGKTSFNIFDTGDKQILETTAHNKNQWYHYVGVLTGGIQYLYRDGVLQGSQSCGNIGNTANGLDFGTNSNTGWFQGKLDEMIIYNHGLIASEVKNRYLFLNGFI